jgi:hypothetical protein
VIRRLKSTCGIIDANGASENQHMQTNCFAMC